MFAGVGTRHRRGHLGVRGSEDGDCARKSGRRDLAGSWGEKPCKSGVICVVGGVIWGGLVERREHIS